EVYTKHIGGEWIGPIDLDWRVLSHFRFQSSISRRGKPSGLLVPIYSNPGDGVRMCVNGVESGLPDACGNTAMDEKNQGKIVLRLEETGAGVQGAFEHDGQRQTYMVGLYATNSEGKERKLTQMNTGPEFPIEPISPG